MQSPSAILDSELVDQCGFPLQLLQKGKRDDSLVEVTTLAT